MPTEDYITKNRTNLKDVTSSSNNPIIENPTSKNNSDNVCTIPKNISTPLNQNKENDKEKDKEVRKYIPKAPYPHRLLGKDKEEQFNEIKDIFKNLHTNFPFSHCS